MPAPSSEGIEAERARSHGVPAFQPDAGAFSLDAEPLAARPDRATQQRLPDALTGSLQECLDWERLLAAHMRSLLASLLEEAHRLGYLEAPFPLRPALLVRTSMEHRT